MSYTMGDEPPIRSYVPGARVPSTISSLASTLSSDPSPNHHDGERPFFTDAEMDVGRPTYDSKLHAVADKTVTSPYDFAVIVYDYLRGLSSRKREKALLNNTMYEAVLHAYRHPEDTSHRTAQFRFWAKKMFTMNVEAGDDILLHDNKPVATREQIYDVLVHCHIQAEHGGRDKTSLQVRKYYSWIPKEIIARFVKLCPTCNSKRTQVSGPVVAMTGPQTFLMGLQETDIQLSNKQCITLAQAKAMRMQLPGYKPMERRGPSRVHMVGNSSAMPYNAMHYPTSTDLAPSYSGSGLFVTGPSYPASAHRPPEMLTQPMPYPYPSAQTYDRRASLAPHGSQGYAAIQAHNSGFLRRVSEGNQPTYASGYMAPQTSAQGQAYAMPSGVSPDYSIADPDKSPDGLSDVRVACATVAAHQAARETASGPIGPMGEYVPLSPSLSGESRTAHITHSLANVHVDQSTSGYNAKSSIAMQRNPSAESCASWDSVLSAGFEKDEYQYQSATMSRVSSQGSADGIDPQLTAGYAPGYRSESSHSMLTASYDMVAQHESEDHHHNTSHLFTEWTNQD